MVYQWAPHANLYSHLSATRYAATPPPTFVDVHLQDFLLADNLATAAGFAAVLVADAPALALAAVAHAGHLLDHAQPQLVQTHLHARTVARYAHLRRPLTPATASTRDREERKCSINAWAFLELQLFISIVDSTAAQTELRTSTHTSPHKTQLEFTNWLAETGKN